MGWTYHYSVSFEFLGGPPATHRGAVTAASTRSGVRKAVDQADKVLKPRNWSSLVVCILERVPDAVIGESAEVTEALADQYEADPEPDP